MTAPQTILNLVERFRANIDVYKGKGYDEADLRQEFLNPFFAALGWDMENKAGYAPPYRDVVHEDRSKAVGPSGTPDYAFRIGGATKFFVEAKRPSADLESDPRWAIQLRRYGWNAKLPACVVTDFEEFAIYDCRIPISPKDTATTARIDYIRFTEYADRWEEIETVFSREAILKGSFDKFATGKHRKRAVKQVDEKFLEDMELWRELLAKEIHKNHSELAPEELNLAVQLIIDRIVFLRMCEDRGIERIAQLHGLMAGPRIYPRLVEIFSKADVKYNSGLFHFTTEKDREGVPDTLTPRLKIDDKVLREILSTLYDDKAYSVYDFSIMPPEILGHVYERFLGKTIRLTPKRVFVDPKPEVRKAGGVYYTPRYIVDYIVKNTIGRLCEGKDVKALSKLRVLDPACGSGSFLLVALQYLYDVHLVLYVTEAKRTGKIPTSPPPEGKRRKKSDPPAVYPVGDTWHLTTAEKKRILLNNIHGVDIDRQAVEVTKLSLLLKVLENENQDTLNSQLKMWAERALPDLATTIKCGNSLIGPEFYHDRQLDLLDEVTEHRVNAFDWKREFPRVFDNGNPGFDAVIGNPPYIRIQHMKEWAPVEVDYYKERFRSARQGSYDIYVVFVERGLDLANKCGVLGFILPSKFFSTDYGANLRTLLTEGEHVSRIVDFGAKQVFESATTYTCLLFLEKHQSSRFEYGESDPCADALQACDFTEIAPVTLGAGTWSFGSEASLSIAEKLSHNTVSLLDLPANMSRGSSTGEDAVFLVEAGSSIVEDELLREPIWATDFGRYKFKPQGKWRILFPYVKESDADYRLLAEEELRARYPRAYEYLKSHKTVLTGRKQFKAWYGYSAPRSLGLHDRAQIVVPLLADRGLGTLVPRSRVGGLFLMASGGFSIALGETVALHPAYVLGLLNSRLLFWFLRTLTEGNVFQGNWIPCTKQYFGKLPIRTISLSDTYERSTHDRIVKLVELMLDLHRKLPETRSDDERTRLERRLAATDQEIDALVYELYGLSKEEIRVVEEAIT
ncbi:MAG: Eco57I restriction-modification methylase domain-containing protein [Deltaproteobacteria bacterium]|nr:Eco57I restriction-modification methylase domain-containing protein [Deltaproteobacteria bacterium]